MCITVRVVDPISGASPWEPDTLVINVPSTVSSSAVAFITAETLRAIGVLADLCSTALVCFCGAPIVLPRRTLSAPTQTTTGSIGVAKEAGVRHGA